MRSNIDFLNNFKRVQVVNPVVVTADKDADTVVDMAGFSRCTFLALLGESGDTLSASVYIELEVEDSPDNSTYTDVVDADLSASVTGNNTGTFGKAVLAGDDQLYVTTYKGNGAYCKAKINITGTHSNGTPIGIVAILHGAEQLPVS